MELYPDRVYTCNNQIFISYGQKTPDAELLRNLYDEVELTVALGDDDVLGDDDALGDGVPAAH